MIWKLQLVALIEGNSIRLVVHSPNKCLHKSGNERVTKQKKMMMI